MKEKLHQHQSRPFHITVAAAGKGGIDNDLRMLKSALIYGDQVKLCSHTTTGVLFLFSVWSNPLDDFVAWGEENIVGIVPDRQQREKLLRGIELGCTPVRGLHLPPFCSRLPRSRRLFAVSYRVKNNG